MKTFLFKNVSLLTLMATLGSAMAIPPPPPPHTLHFSVTNYTQVLSYSATGTWRDGRSDTKVVTPTNSVTFTSDGTYAEYGFEVTVKDSNGNACSASGDQNDDLTVTSNPSSDAKWSCLADGSNLKVVPLS